ncbi:MAG: hypothetical protein ABGX15_06830 [Paracoccaceae bacterium]
MKPDLILHPGFPKCATSSIQLLFVKERHAVARALGVRFIGADFKPDNGFPSVSKLMYDYDACIADVAATDYPDRRYFMSNEALNMQPQFIAVLKERFNVVRSVCTIRFPTTQAISSFRYSGWLTCDFAEFVKTRQKWLFHNVANKYSTRRFRELTEAPRLVSVEGPDDMRLEERFCQAAFDEVPAILSEAPFNKMSRANEAPPLAFADALARAMRGRATSIPGPDRNRVVSAAKSHPLPDELRNLGGPQVAMLPRRQVIDCLNEYQAFLVASGTDRTVAAAARASAAASYHKLCEQGDPTPAQLRALDDEARRLLDNLL